MARGRKTGGRRKGTPNKVTSELRDSVLEALEQCGGVEYLVGIARADPMTFCKLLVRLMPASSPEIPPPEQVTYQIITGVERNPDDLPLPAGRKVSRGHAPSGR